MRLILPPMKTRIRQSPHLPLLVSRKGMSRVRPAITEHTLDQQRSRLRVDGERVTAPTSVVKQPPDVDGSFALFLLKLLAALQQPLLSGTEGRPGLCKQHGAAQKAPLREGSSAPPIRRWSSASPLMTGELLWFLVSFEGLESESESFAGLTETATSRPPIGGFS